MDLASIHLEAWIVALLAGTVIPILTGVATKLDAAPGKKALVSLGISALVTVLNSIVYTNGAFVLRDMVVLFVTTFTWHAAWYQGFLKHVGGGAAPGALATADIGIG